LLPAAAQGEKWQRVNEQVRVFEETKLQWDDMSRKAPRENAYRPII
jgi:hypothetical protein